MAARLGPQATNCGQTVAVSSELVPEPEIVCIDCGGRAHLLSYPPEDGFWLPGDVVAYRCSDCLDRWDLVLPDAGDYSGD
jgi:DNA-directed RNA polymerase subunit RPC12/RpoP